MASVSSVVFVASVSLVVFVASVTPVVSWWRDRGLCFCLVSLSLDTLLGCDFEVNNSTGHFLDTIPKRSTVRNTGGVSYSRIGRLGATRIQLPLPGPSSVPDTRFTYERASLPRFAPEPRAPRPLLAPELRSSRPAPARLSPARAWSLPPISTELCTPRPAPARPLPACALPPRLTGWNEVEGGQMGRSGGRCRSPQTSRT